MKLWQKNTQVSDAVEAFTVGNDRELDVQLAPFDVLGSIAHVTMLAEVGLLTKEEAVIPTTPGGTDAPFLAPTTPTNKKNQKTKTITFLKTK